MARWRFFQGLKAEWRWYQLGANGNVIAASDQGFRELPACMANAERAGFTHSNYQVQARTQIKLPSERRKHDRSLSQN